MPSAASHAPREDVRVALARQRVAREPGGERLELRAAEHLARPAAIIARVVRELDRVDEVDLARGRGRDRERESRAPRAARRRPSDTPSAHETQRGTIDVITHDNPPHYSNKV